MSADIALARKIGMRYRITPSGAEELYGSVLEIQAFADAVRFREHARTKLTQLDIREHYREKVPQSGYGPGFDAFDGMGYDLN